MSVTEQDRERIWQIVLRHSNNSQTAEEHEAELEDLAQALADERERVTTKFVALAEDLERGFYGYEHTEREIADLIRHAAQETQ